MALPARLRSCTTPPTSSCSRKRPSPVWKATKRARSALASLPTPCYLLDEGQLRRNGELLLGVQQRTGCKILLAQKAFSNFNVYPVLAPYLAGTEASGLYESRLGKEELPENSAK